MKYYGALEAGGTKMLLSIMDETGNVHEQTRLPTKTPAETMPEMLAFFSAQPISALGSGGFGPLNLDRRSPRYGSIMETPKLAWRGYPVLRAFEEALSVPVRLDTDVNGAALAGCRYSEGTRVEFKKNAAAYFDHCNSEKSDTIVRKGSIAVDKDADFCLADEDMNISRTILRGETIYNAEG